MRTRLSYSCDSCGWHIHPTAGTLFHHSHIPLSTWFAAITRITADPYGATPHILRNELRLSPRSANRVVGLVNRVLDEDEDDLTTALDRAAAAMTPRRHDTTPADGSRASTLPPGLQHELVLLIAESAASGWTVRHTVVSTPMMERLRPSGHPASSSGPPPGDPREKILEAACRAVVKHGMGATRVSDIAREAGVSSAVVHYHFATKDAVLLAAASWVERETLAQRDAIMREDTRAVRKLGRFLGEQSLRNDLSRQEIILYVGLWGRAMRSPRYRVASTRSRHKWRTYFARILQQGVQTGEFHPRASVDDVVERVTAFLDGITIQVLVGHPWLDEERAAELTFDLFAAEFGCDPGELRSAAAEWQDEHSRLPDTGGHIPRA